MFSPNLKQLLQFLEALFGQFGLDPHLVDGGGTANEGQYDIETVLIDGHLLIDVLALEPLPQDDREYVFQSSQIDQFLSDLLLYTRIS